MSRKWMMIWLLAIVVFGAVSGNQFISYDESYTMMLIQHPWKEVISITGMDVHPPLYYLLAKFVAAPFGYPLAAVKAVNLLPLFGMMVLGRRLVTKMWGEGTGMWFSVLAVCLPANQTYLLPELRMYGLAAFLVLCNMVFGLILIEKREDILRSSAAWAGFFLSGIAVAYTQYYALVAVALMYLAVAGNMILRKEKKWAGWFLCTGLSALCYLPWLVVLLGQLRAVKADYWIPPITLRSILSYIMFPFYSGMHVVTGLLLALVMVGILLWGGGWKVAIEHKKMMITTIIPYCGMIAIGVIVSVVMRPVFSVRYVKCVLGILVLVLAFLFARLEKGKQRVLQGTFCLFVLVNTLTIWNQNRDNNATYRQMEQYAREHVSENAVILYPEDGHFMGVFSYLFAEWEQVIPNEYYQDEYKAFAPVLSSKSVYEQRNGNLRDHELWVIDVGNMQHYRNWNMEEWDVLETSPFYYFRDGTDILQCMLTKIE